MNHERATTYTISAISPDVDEMLSYDFAITVELAHHNPETWAVRRLSRCLGRDGQWVYEPLPSSRTDEWLAEHRFTLDEALKAARHHAPLVTINGMTVADVLHARQVRR